MIAKRKPEKLARRTLCYEVRCSRALQLNPRMSNLGFSYA